MTATEALRRDAIVHDRTHPEYPQWAKDSDASIQVIEDDFLAPLVRHLSELPPIEAPAMQSTYPAAQARVHTAHLCRTPIDPVTAVRSPGLQKGNSDLKPAAWNPPAWLKPLIGVEE